MLQLQQLEQLIAFTDQGTLSNAAEGFTDFSTLANAQYAELRRRFRRSTLSA